MASSQPFVSPALRLAPDVILDQSPDAAVASFECAICTTIGSEDCPDSTIYVDARGEYMRGAEMSPGHGWACSQRCLSQLMFQSATLAQQAHLKRFQLALEAIEEVAPELDAMLEEWGMDIGWWKLQRAVEGAHKHIGYDKHCRSNPAWIVENEEPVEELRRVVRHSVNLLEWKAIDPLQSRVALAIFKGSPYEACRSAMVAASIGNVMEKLKAVIA